MGWKFFNSSGRVLTSLGDVALTDIDIDGGTDIGAAIVDADLFIIDDGAGGTNRKTEASRLKTYIGSESGVAKAWCRVTTAGALVSGDYNIASVTDTGVGTRSLVIDTDFADLYYVPTATISNDTGAAYAGTANFNTYAVGSVTIVVRQWSGGTETTLDLPHGQALFGDQ